MSSEFCIQLEESLKFLERVSKFYAYFSQLAAGTGRVKA